MSATAYCLACGGELAETPAVRTHDRMDAIPGTWSVHSCRRCDSGTTLPLATDAELPAFYAADYAPFRISRGPVAAARARAQHLGDRRFPLSKLAGTGAGGVLLDVGCGRGELAGSWLSRGWRVLGIEPSPQAAAAAKLRGAEIVGTTLADCSIARGSLDAAVFSHSLEHVTDPRADLQRVFALLRPGGRVGVIAPNWGSWQRRAFGEYWFPLELPRHRTHFTAAGLHSALSAAGFSDIEIRPSTPFITTTWSLQYRLLNRLVTREGPALLAGYLACALIAPVAAGLDRSRGGGDFLHAVAHRARP